MSVGGVLSVFILFHHAVLLTESAFLNRRSEHETLGLTRKNPLLNVVEEDFPPFDSVQPDDVVPALTQLLDKAKDEVELFEQELQKPGFEPGVQTLLQPYSLLGEPLWAAHSVVSHLKSVKDSPELRKAMDVIRPKLVQHSERVSQSQPLFAAFQALRNSSSFAKLTPAQKRVVDLELQGFELGGIGLKGLARQEFNNITRKLSNLSTSYSENVLDSTKAWRKVVTTPTALRGIPEGPLRVAAQAARQEPIDGEVARLVKANANQSDEVLGPFLLTLDGPAAGAVLTYAEDPTLRKEVFIESAKRASELAQPDNTPVLKEMLQLRQRQAELLGFRNYVELSMQSKMATTTSAMKLMQQLQEVARPHAVADWDGLLQFVKASSPSAASHELEKWDASYWSHLQVKSLFDIDAEELRPYFPLQRCLDGMFGLAGKMFGVRFERVDGPLWHKDVILFKVHRSEDETSPPVAYLYMDLYTRPAEKNDGAWQVGLRDFDARRGKTPIAGIVANFRPPVGDHQALLSFGELHTLFHEFGHSLQHMLTTQAEPSLSGTSGIEWDAVELPSQFMEYWLDETDWVVRSIARHHETGEELPMEKFMKLKAAAKHHAGLGMLGQLHLSFLDLDVHQHPLKADERPHDRDVAVGVERKTSLLPPVAEDRFLCHFSHIFAGGYDAGYYSYKWAEVLSADAFSLFQESGAIADSQQSLEQLRAIGQKFASTILAEGGGRKAAEVFASFRGREPSTEPLLRYTFGTSNTSKTA